MHSNGKWNDIIIQDLSGFAIMQFETALLRRNDGNLYWVFFQSVWAQDSDQGTDFAWVSCLKSSTYVETIWLMHMLTEPAWLTITPCIGDVESVQQDGAEPALVSCPCLDNGHQMWLTQFKRGCAAMPSLINVLTIFHVKSVSGTSMAGPSRLMYLVMSMSTMTVPPHLTNREECDFMSVIHQGAIALMSICRKVYPFTQTEDFPTALLLHLVFIK